MTAEEWVRLFEARARRNSEQGQADIAKPGITPEDKARASTRHVIYNLISMEVKAQLAEGFDNPDAEHRDWMVTNASALAEQYEQTWQQMEPVSLRLPQTENMLPFHVMIGLIQQTFAALHTLAQPDTPDNRAVLTQVVVRIRSTHEFMRDQILRNAGSGPVQ